MRIDATTVAAQPFAGAAESRHSDPVAMQNQSSPDTVQLSSLASGNADGAVTSHAAGLIAGNATGALSAHGHIDPERAMRLVGLLD